MKRSLIKNRPQLCCYSLRSCHPDKTQSSSGSSKYWILMLAFGNIRMTYVDAYA